MKTTTKIQKNILSKLTRVLMFGAIICFGFKANAQCTAGYTYTIDTANDGDVSFTNTSTGTGLYYSWDFGDGGYSSLMNPGTYNYASSGTYTACLTVYDSMFVFDSTLGCYNIYCSTYTVINSSSTGTCSASFMPFDSSGYGYFINTSTGTGLTSTWDFGDGTTATTSGDAIHLYPGPGTYYVCLTISDFSGTCANTYCDSITISSSGGTCNAFFVSNDSLSYTQFYDYSTGSGSLNYFWDFGDGTNSTTVGDETHVYASAGTYIVCLTISDSSSSCSDTYCSSVTVGSSASCNASFTIVQDSTNLYNYFVYNTSTYASGTVTYLWDFGDGTTSTAAYPSHTYTSTAPVVLCLTIADSSGCTDTYCDSITPGMMMSSVFTINVVPLGVIEQASAISSLENYPNPFSDNTTINYAINKDANVSISIIDLLGNTIAELENGNKTSGEYSTTWNAENVAEGMYLLQLKVNNDISTKKIIVNR